MPSVVDQPCRPPTQHLARPPIFFHYFIGAPQHLGENRRRTFRALRMSGAALLLFEARAPDLRTARAKMPMPSASNPSTGSGLLWTGNSATPNRGNSAISATPLPPSA